MTPQAKNRVLATIVLVMLAIVAVAAVVGRSPSEPVAVLVPSKTYKVVFITPPEPSYAASEFECMRLNLYYEAGNQTKRGMEAVALVTLNRTKTKTYPTTVCGVVKAWAYNKRGVKVCQFSWYCDGKSDTPNLHNVLERKAWEMATKVARAALEGKLTDFLGRSTHYHATYVNPGFANVPSRYQRLTQVGKHIFYHDKWLKHRA